MAETKSKLKLLAVLAHPDDESFGIGGTLALYAQRGIEVHLICATRGEAGDVNPEDCKGFNSVAELRESELRCAAGILGLAGVHFLNYRDSGMPGSVDNSHPNALIQAGLDEVAAKIVTCIREIRPQVVVTFDPIGGYRHPDHIHIHLATVRAFQASGNSAEFRDGLPAFRPQKLYYQTISRGFLRLVVYLLRFLRQDPTHYGRNKDIDIASLAAESFPVHAEIDFRRVAERRAQAAACHSSQGGAAMSRGFQGWLLNRYRTKELYMRAYPEPGNSERREKDLFAGISI